MGHLFITGASRRLGLFLTEKFLAAGWRVSVLTRSTSPELAALNCDTLAVYECDYDDQRELQAMVEKLKRTPLDVIIHNASLFISDQQCTAEERAFERMFHVHMALPAWLNNQLGEHLARSPNGNIVHMTDIYADKPQPSFSLYCATKAGLSNLNKSFAQKLAPNVRVNAIAPGALKFLPEHSDEQKKAVLEGSLIPIEAGFEPILNSIHYLLDNHFLTGTTLTVDGGRSLCR